MKTFRTVSVILSALLLGLLNQQCKKADQGMIEAAVSTDQNCDTDINYSGTHVYAYRADAFFAWASVQAGGHTGGDFPDLGVNVFATTVGGGFPQGLYPIDGGSTIPRTAYVYYLPTSDPSSEYISLDNQGNLNVTNIRLMDDGTGLLQVTHFNAEFNNSVLMVNFNTSDTICIDMLTLSVSI